MPDNQFKKRKILQIVFVEESRKIPGPARVAWDHYVMESWVDHVLA